jgi:hypothetical protein
MAERKIVTRNLWKATAVGSGSAGGTSLTDAIDLRDISAVGSFGLSYTIATAGAAATCASCKVSYLGCAVFDGTYIACTAGTCVTTGNAGGSDIISISPPVFPFIKFQVIAGTSGTAAITADLHIR